MRRSPRGVLSFLRTELRATNPQSWTFGIFQRGFKGGHAITPYAIEEVGRGRYDVLVYDNNWPGDANRRLHIDTRANTWSYYAADQAGRPRRRATRATRSRRRWR